jgi:hypothetical protein
MLVARKGYKVLFVNQASFPSDIVSIHYIHQPGAPWLRQWVLLEASISSNCPPIMGCCSTLVRSRWKDHRRQCGVADPCVPRRIVLDKVLLNAAVTAGRSLSRETPRP